MSIIDFFSRERFGTPGLEQVGIGGFSLMARVKEKVKLSAGIPESYVEDGSPLNDHIQRKAEKLTIEGVAGDIYLGPETSRLDSSLLGDALGFISSYLPLSTPFQSHIMTTLVNTTSTAINALDSVLGAGGQLNNLFGNLDSSSYSLGEQFIDAMENIYYGNQLVSIDMPYRSFDSMVLTEVEYERDNETGAIHFKVEAQRFRIAEVAYATVQASPAAAPAASSAGQTADVKDMGSQAGAPQDQSFLAHYSPF